MIRNDLNLLCRNKKSPVQPAIMPDMCSNFPMGDFLSGSEPQQSSYMEVSMDIDHIRKVEENHIYMATMRPVFNKEVFFPIRQRTM